MSAPITYSLSGPDGSSNHYFTVVRGFADEVRSELERRHGSAAGGFLHYCAVSRPSEPQRSRTEYLLDLLVMGVLWREHHGAASRLSSWFGRAVAWVAGLRRRGGACKRAADAFRAVVNTVLLLRRPSDHQRELAPSLDGLDRLMRWLAATAEYRREVERLALWQGWLRTLDEREANDVMCEILQTAAWFSSAAQGALGQFTHNVPAFLRDKAPRHRWNEDVISVSKTSAEYHLAMVGAELMNRAFRPAFLSCQRRVVLLPGCMRAKPATCDAVSSPRGQACTGCTPGCKVNHVARLGQREGFDVRVLHHASDLSVWAPRDGEEATGVVGVACMAPLLAGGWELRALGLAAQCVPLDGCGCQAHWDDRGQSTKMNLVELKRLLGSERRALTSTRLRPTAAALRRGEPMSHPAPPARPCDASQTTALAGRG